MIGKRFGRLLVIADEGSFHSKKHTEALWRCRCDCGNECLVLGGNLRSGHTTSCGQCMVTYEDCGEYIKGIDSNGKEFIFDRDDFEVVKNRSWHVAKSGYVESGSHSGATRLHQFLMKPPRGCVVDHINGKRDDCRRSNMRIATNQENVFNARLSKANTSGYKGVVRVRNGKYSARIEKDGKHMYLGTYSDPIEAARAYDKAARFYFGEFAKPNFGEGGIYGREEKVLALAEQVSR